MSCSGDRSLPDRESSRRNLESRVLKRRTAATLLAALAALAVPAVASAEEEPLPACTGDAAGTISIDGLPRNLAEGQRYKFTISDGWYDDVEVSLAVEGQAPYWTGMLSEDDFDEDFNMWIEADKGDGPLQIVAKTRHEVENDEDEPFDCEVIVTRTVTHSTPQTAVMCSDYDGDGNYPAAKARPRTCTLGQQNWTYHAQGFVGLRKIHWRQWGKSAATARAVWRENMGEWAKVRVRFYRLRPVGSYRVYTRAKVHVLWSTWGRRNTFTVKLPTREQ
jgi:hypothetical protein